MNSDLITLKIPAKPEYVMITRLTSAAIASRIGFDVDEIEDIKMSIAEAIILIINQLTSPKEILVKFQVKTESLYMEIIGEGGWEESDISTHDIGQAQLGKYIIGSVMDGVEFKSDNGIMRGIFMHKECGGLIDQ